jgi:Holliday junction resolvase RusA-like endonuclease
MPDTLHVYIPGPFCSERKRGVRRGSHTAFVDTPDRADWKAHAKACAHRIMAGRAPFDGPLTLAVCWVALPPTSLPKRPTKVNPWPWAPWKKPDRDNLHKILQDALNKIVWTDDARLVAGPSAKLWDWSDDDHETHQGVHLTVAHLPPHYADLWRDFVHLGVDRHAALAQTTATCATCGTTRSTLIALGDGWRANQAKGWTCVQCFTPTRSTP